MLCCYSREPPIITRVRKSAAPGFVLVGRPPAASVLLPHPVLSVVMCFSPTQQQAVVLVLGKILKLSGHLLT